MPCFRPLKAYRARGGGVVFDINKATSPSSFDLPCGQCIGCRVARSRAWALRCVHEAQMHKENCFITLTYDKEHLPVTGSLDVTAWQKFIKRWRKYLEGVSPRERTLRYFMCGEYGDKNLRPHYHACIFGQDLSRDRVLLRENRGNRLYISPFLEKTWGNGFCTVGDLTYESAAYVARYVMKKVTGARAAEHYGERKPEFVCMSRGYGIGSKWLDRFHDDVYPADEVVYDGRRFRPPRFYDSKLPDDELEGLKIARRRKVNKRKEDLTPERLEVRERVAVARLSQLERDL